jgi:hypothetical protein
LLKEKIMEVTINIKKANSKMYRLKRSDGAIIYLDSNIKKQKKTIDFLEGKDLK